MNGLGQIMGVTGQERMPDVARSIGGNDFLRTMLMLQNLRFPHRSEVSITIERDGKFFNIPSIDRITGKAMSQPEAVRRAESDGLLRRALGFDSLDDAVAAARSRSKSLSFGRQPGPAPMLPGGVPSRGRLMDQGQIALREPQPVPGSVLERALMQQPQQRGAR